ncbi:class I SAM-dependent methyltransferase [Barrientosiimonas humi]|uniref:class I SAM-dependent methyltransferase n=1 Tax=Barrientosiimonas humi TaxID=999931 RepID=UPI00370D3F61
MALPMRTYRTTGRSLSLLRAFRQEQARPDAFYGPLADDTVAIIEQYADLDGAVVADVGSGPAQFAEAFNRAGARYVGFEVDGHTLRLTENTAGAIARGEQLPLADNSIDVVISSNVLEHVPVPSALADELMRVCRPGGLVFLSYTLWYGPWGGHETSPWHFLGGHYAARRYERVHGRPPKNVFGESMFAATMAQGLRWAEQQRAGEVLFAGPRYAPWWFDPITAVPGLRELLGWNLLVLLRKHEA